jgi:uncharacterized protein (DUF1786 family)
MKVTQTTSLPPASLATTLGKGQRKAAMGGGSITPAVAAHMGRKDRPAQKKAAIGGGSITPAVAAHMRRKAAGATERSI